MTLSVVISTATYQPHLSQLLASVENQSVKCEVILETGDTYPRREEGFARSTSDLVLFLDGDCELPEPHFIKNLIQYFEQNPIDDVVGGFYLNPPKANVITRSYNQVCNLWVQAGEGQNLLGGNFCLRREKLKKWPCSQKFWGGEDTLLFRTLSTQGLILKASSLFSVVHHDNGSFKKLVKRAWIHGRARKARGIKTQARYQNIWINRKFWLENLSIKEFSFTLLHYSLVTAAGILTRPKISPNK